MIIAIDGGAASGKSTVARGLAVRLGVEYLDTGAMYRALAWKALHQPVPILDDDQALTGLAEAADIRFEHEGGSPLPARVLIDGEDVTLAIRAPETDAAVSVVARVPGVRHAMVARQRSACDGVDCVVEGRDIGTVVFPNAEVKVFLEASPEARARRRAADMERAGHEVAEDEVRERLLHRDEIDTARVTSPLKPAEDAVRIDTSEMSPDEVVGEIVALASARRGGLRG